MSVRALVPSDVESIVERVHNRLERDARRCNLVNPRFSKEEFANALAGTTNQSWIVLEDGRLAGHLYGAIFETPNEGLCAWTGPDGVSFNRDESLVEL
ncbi:MAG: hypothetical protein ACYCPT_00005, partial [Acidimicrobiales bacterium]